MRTCISGTKEDTAGRSSPRKGSKLPNNHSRRSMPTKELATAGQRTFSPVSPRKHSQLPNTHSRRSQPTKELATAVLRTCSLVSPRKDSQLPNNYSRKSLTTEECAITCLRTCSLETADTTGGSSARTDHSSENLQKVLRTIAT